MAIPTIIVHCGSTPVDLVSVLVEVGIFFCLYFIVSLTVNLEFGFTGIPNFGKVLFVSAGGLIAGSLSYRLALYVLNLTSSDVIGSQAFFITIVNSKIDATPVFGFELLLFSLAVGAGVAALFGFLASYPAIRLREDYLGMLLLAAGQFFMIFVTAYYPITGGTEGLLIPDPLNWSSSVSGLRDIVTLGILGVASVLVFLYVERAAGSPLGRMLRAVRDNETSSDAIGKNTIGVRRNVLIIASAIAGIAGVLFVMWSTAISPTTFIRTEWTFYPFVIVILGGAANNKGVAVGSLVFVTITEAISQAQTCLLTNDISLPFGLDINAMVPIALGVLLLVVLLVRPKGLIPEHSTLTVPKSKLDELYDRANKVVVEETVPDENLQSTDLKDATAPTTQTDPPQDSSGAG
jgi:branched-chain amino acid transport system permease protein